MVIVPGTVLRPKVVVIVKRICGLYFQKTYKVSERNKTSMMAKHNNSERNRVPWKRYTGES